MDKITFAINIFNPNIVSKLLLLMSPGTSASYHFNFDMFKSRKGDLDMQDRINTAGNA